MINSTKEFLDESEIVLFQNVNYSSYNIMCKIV